MKKILDYDEMIEILNKLSKENIKEKEPIGYTEFGYPIRHYTYGTGEHHVILTAGTHSVELITNHFLIKLMQEINNNEIIDKNKFTIHFIPILNPEGTVIVTSAIRTLIPRDINEFDEEQICIQYYNNSKLEDNYANKYNDHDIKLHNWMFRYATTDCIKDKKLRENVKKIINNNKLPKGILIEWGSNGSGIDLNANIETGRYLDDLNKIVNGKLKQNTINKLIPGPFGCPTRSKVFTLEKENEAITKFYINLSKKYKVIGSLIYHSCGGEVIYLGDEVENPWKNDYNKYDYNLKIAKRYAELTDYTIKSNSNYYTMDTKLKTIVPGSLLIELSKIRANPLSQFIDYGKNNYTNTINININAIIKIIEEMSKEYNKIKV